ncbi:unnamed protein product [Owenia fusiformis]|uniref:Uncharacterized protein n=1 Tax=Owenia fusiformis TaxID=6347 RepID=A0A8J1UT21_OWEFU|nr:unnamed protein product [Owenia fusiformis]
MLVRRDRGERSELWEGHSQDRVNFHGLSSFQVSIESGDSGFHGCNGFIIDSQWVVSAQHCYGVGTDPADLTIWVQNFYQYPQDGTPHTPTTIVFHPDYDNESYEHDIVMMKLPTPLVWNDDLRPICMPEAGNLYEGADAWLAGWGNEYQGGPPTADLQHVQLTIITNDDCKIQVGPNDEWMVLPNTLCHRGDGKDAGDGDSGGLIMVKDSNNTFRAAGIQSWGYWPAGERPSVCTRITSHIDYINQVRQNN